MTGKERTGSAEEEGWRKRELDLRSDRERELDLRSDRERENRICGGIEKEWMDSVEADGKQEE